jgi:hypothetical protein
MSQRSLLALVASLALATSLAAQCNISTISTSNNGLGGVAFDVVNTSANPVRLTQMFVDIDVGTFDVQLYALAASGPATLANLGQPGLWNQLGSFAGVTSTAMNVPTALPAFCSAVDIPAGATQAFYFFTTTGAPVNYTTGTAAGTLVLNDGTLSILEGFGIGANFPGTGNNGRIPRVSFDYICPGPPGPPPPADYQVNQSAIGLNINNVSGSACQPTSITQNVFSCTPVAPATGTVSMRTNMASAFWELVIGAGTLVPASAGGITLSPGEIVNINLAAPIIVLNNFFATALPGGGIPGANSATVSFGYALGVAADIGFQAAVLDPSAPIGIRMSQATELHTVVLPPSASVAGPIADTANVAVNVVSAPNCWTAAGVPFFGVNYPTINVSSNGRVTFTAVDTDGTASVAEVATDGPFTGCWVDLNPALGGNITVTNPAAGVVRVNYNAVPYAGEAATANTFAIEFDSNTGDVRLDGLSGIVANPQTTLTTADAMLLGITRGNLGATVGTAQVFTAGVPSLATNATDGIYDFYLQVAAGAGRCASLVPGTLNGILFSPSAGFSPNYDAFPY